ncbi:MAG: TatD family hydrolase [Firmicutes bacterium]|nr:TatD family hydrolase [Bacillota bacterium]
MLFDTHAHYDDERFDKDRYEVIEKVHQEGVSYIINASSDVKSVRVSVELAQKYPYVYAAIGIHPHNAEEVCSNIIPSLYEWAACDKVVAIGEIGLDYYYDFTPREVQIRCFAEQISVAKELSLPIIVHNRDSHEDILRIIKGENAKEVGGVFHCFSGSVEMAREVLNNNFYISVGGPVTFKNARRVLEVLKYVPDDRLLVETDCPYLTPEPYRGKRNDSGYLKYIVEKVAEIKGMTFEETAEITMGNARRLFGVGPPEVNK